MDSHSPVSLALPQEKEMEKQRLLYQQARLHNRGAAEMVLQMISACKGALHVQPVLLSYHPVFTLPNPPFPVLPAARTPTHACQWFAHTPSPSHVPLALRFLTHPSVTITLARSATASLTSPGMAVFWWVENAAPKLSRLSSDHLLLQERRAPWCPPP